MLPVGGSRNRNVVFAEYRSWVQFHYLLDESGYLRLGINSYHSEADVDITLQTGPHIIRFLATAIVAL